MLPANLLHGSHTIGQPDKFTTWGWSAQLAVGQTLQFCRYAGPARALQWQVQLVNAPNTASVNVDVQAGVGRGSFTNNVAGVRHYGSGTVYAESATVNVTNAAAVAVTVVAFLVPADAVQPNPPNVATQVTAAASSTTTVAARARTFAIVTCNGTGPLSVSLVAGGAAVYVVATGSSVRIDNWQGPLYVTCPAATTGTVTEGY